MTVTTEREKIVRIDRYVRVVDVAFGQVYYVMNFLRRSSADPAGIPVPHEDPLPNAPPQCGVVKGLCKVFRHVFRPFRVRRLCRALWSHGTRANVRRYMSMVD